MEPTDKRYAGDITKDILLAKLAYEICEFFYFKAKTGFLLKLISSRAKVKERGSHGLYEQKKRMNIFGYLFVPCSPIPVLLVLLLVSSETRVNCFKL